MRESKLSDRRLDNSVAPHLGARIKIRTRPVEESGPECRTLYGCANRNLANAIALAIQMSHLTRCANQNEEMFFSLHQQQCRTSHRCANQNTEGGRQWREYTGRTLRGCANQNTICVTDSCAIGRTLRGCVNQNHDKDVDDEGNPVAPHAGARIEMRQ